MLSQTLPRESCDASVRDIQFKAVAGSACVAGHSAASEHPVERLELYHFHSVQTEPTVVSQHPPNHSLTL